MATGLRSYNVAPIPGEAPIDGGVPIGTILMWSVATPPSGFLPCGGTAVLRTQYPSLFAVIGTTYGAGDGVTTFNLPNTQNRVVRGVGSTFAPIGFTGGNDAPTIGTDNLPFHSHPITDPQHSHNVVLTGGYTADTYAAVVNGTIEYIGLAFGGSGNRVSDTDAAQLVSTGITQTDNNITALEPLSVINQFITFNYIIRAT